MYDILKVDSLHEELYVKVTTKWGDWHWLQQNLRAAAATHYEAGGASPRWGSVATRRWREKHVSSEHTRDSVTEPLNTG